MRVQQASSGQPPWRSGWRSRRAAPRAVHPDGEEPRAEAAQGHQKQGSKNTLCTAKALLKCEENGVVDRPECDAANPGASTVPDPNDKIVPKLVADIAKCESKLDYAKKSATGNSATDYTALGCPGDSVPGGADDPFADLAARTRPRSARPRARSSTTLRASLTCDLHDDATTSAPSIRANRGLAYAKGALQVHREVRERLQGQEGQRRRRRPRPPRATRSAAATRTSPTCTGTALTKAQKKGPLDGTVQERDRRAPSPTPSNDLLQRRRLPVTAVDGSAAALARPVLAERHGAAPVATHITGRVEARASTAVRETSASVDAGGAPRFSPLALLATTSASK